MIRILGTTRKEFFSGVIRRVTGEPISHVAIRVKDKVIHANRDGVTIDDYDYFVEHNEVIYEIKPRLRSTEKAIADKIASSEEMVGRKYDFFAILFLGAMLILRLWFGKTIPKQNLWNVSGMYICTEYVSEITSTEKDNAMITPEGLINAIIKTGKWQYVTKP